MTQRSVPAVFIGQVERDSHGRLWAMLYSGEVLISREEVFSLRQGRRRVTDMVLAAADAAAAPAVIPLQGRRGPPQRLQSSSPPTTAGAAPSEPAAGASRSRRMSATWPAGARP